MPERVLSRSVLEEQARREVWEKGEEAANAEGCDADPPQSPTDPA